MYYKDKLETLRDVFGSNDVNLNTECLIVDGCTYPIVDDVIILLGPEQYPESLKSRMTKAGTQGNKSDIDFAKDIQFTFGEEWKKFSEILPEHKHEFTQYFDLVDLSGLKNYRICDLGCGIGRWSSFLKDKCRELILVDFSEAIFVARRNLADTNNALFFMGDIKKLPFRKDFTDLLFCIGVLHHLPAPALSEVRALKKYASRLLIYLYYSLDNRPFYFRFLLSSVTKIRLLAAHIKNPTLRDILCFSGALGIYLPLVWLGSLLKPLGLSQYVPLYEGYHGKGLERIRQDVYDRFFTRIEQRVSKKEIMELEDAFKKITVSDQLPYWHFLCER